MKRLSRPGGVTVDQGFTMVELMVTLALLTTIVMFALPSFAEFIKNTRIAMTTNDFMGDMEWARSEAVRRGGTVSVCRSTTETSCTAGIDWADGWIVFVDVNGNGDVDTGEDTVIRARPSPASGSVTLTAASNPNPKVDIISFTSTGMLRSGSADVTFNVCDDRTGKTVGTSILLQAFGKLFVTSTQLACS